MMANGSLNYFTDNSLTKFSNIVPPLIKMKFSANPLFVRLRRLIISHKLIEDTPNIDYIKIHLSQLEPKVNNSKFDKCLAVCKFPPSEISGEYAIQDFENSPFYELQSDELHMLSLFITDSENDQLQLDEGPTTIAVLEISDMDYTKQFTITCRSHNNYEKNLYPNTLSKFRVRLPSEFHLNNWEVSLLNMIFPPDLTLHVPKSIITITIKTNFATKDIVAFDAYGTEYKLRSPILNNKYVLGSFSYDITKFISPHAIITRLNQDIQKQWYGKFIQIEHLPEENSYRMTLIPLSFDWQKNTYDSPEQLEWAYRWIKERHYIEISVDPIFQDLFNLYPNTGRTGGDPNFFKIILPKQTGQLRQRNRIIFHSPDSLHHSSLDEIKNKYVNPEKKKISSVGLLYCSVVEPSPISNILAPLLHIVPIKAYKNYKYDADEVANLTEAKIYEPKHLVFHPVINREFSDIEFELLQPDGTKHDFTTILNPEDYHGVHIELLFREQQKKQ